MMTANTDNENTGQLRRAVTEAMSEQGTNPYRLARELGMHPTQLREWLNGRRRMIRSDLLEPVMDRLGVTVGVKR